MKRNSLALCAPPRNPSACTKMPSLPSSEAPSATAVPRGTRRGSVVTSWPLASRTITQSMRGSAGRVQAPSTFT